MTLAPDAYGRMRGALQIDLELGWKTYWIAPGSVGLAPQLDFERSTGINKPAIFYPVPHRFREGSDVSIGYAGPTAFAFEAQASSSITPTVRLDLLIGICREICVPVVAHLEATPGTGLTVGAAVSSAFTALPTEDPAPLDWSVQLVNDGKALRISVPIIDTDSPVDVYLSGPEGWLFGTPLAEGVVDEGRTTFEAPVVERPSNLTSSLKIDILLTSGETARFSRSLHIEQF